MIIHAIYGAAILILLIALAVSWRELANAEEKRREQHERWKSAYAHASSEGLKSERELWNLLNQLTPEQIKTMRQG